MQLKKWEEIILNCDDAYFFHSPEWVKILEKTYDFQNATRLFEVNGKEILVPMVKNKRYGLNVYYSMPGSAYGGFISKDLISSDEINTIINEIIGGRNITFNFTLSPLTKQSFDFNNSLINKIKDQHYCTHIIFLNENFDYIWKNKFKSKTRTAIRKAKRNNVEIRKADSLQDFKDFYFLWYESTKRWGSDSSPDSLEFFKNLFKYGSDYVDLDLAIYDNEIIAGLLALNYGKNIFLWNNFHLKKYSKLNANSLIFCNSIKNAISEGYKIYNMGASGDISGIKRFKAGLGAEKVNINRFEVYSNLGKFSKYLLKNIRRIR